MLEQQGYKPENVPSPGTQVVILRNGNLAIDVTDDVHPEFARWAELAARVVGLDVAGIDLLADDIGQIPDRAECGASSRSTPGQDCKCTSSRSRGFRDRSARPSSAHCSPRVRMDGFRLSP